VLYAVVAAVEAAISCSKAELQQLSVAAELQQLSVAAVQICATSWSIADACH